MVVLLKSLILIGFILSNASAASQLTSMFNTIKCYGHGDIILNGNLVKCIERDDKASHQSYEEFRDKVLRVKGYIQTISMIST